jgi:ferritin-like metal-binding protein YciE
MAATKLEDIFLMTLKDIYHGEKQIVKALPKLAKHAESVQLKRALDHHLEETKGQVVRIERVFELPGSRHAERRARPSTGRIEARNPEKAENGCVRRRMIALPRSSTTDGAANSSARQPARWR